MHPCLRGVPVLTVAAPMAAGLASCGQGGGSEGPDTPGRESLSIGLLLPDNQRARYETFDRPLVERRIKERCGNCVVEYANARGDVAIQQQQMAAMIARGATS